MNKTLLFALAGALLIAATVMISTQSTLKDAPINDSVIQQWKNFKKTYKLKFSDPDQEVYRMEIFANNLQVIANDTTGTLGVTQFSDLSQEEFAQTYLNLEVNQNAPQAVQCKADQTVNVNWVTAGGVTAVKNQGQCGSCWAFSTTGAIESSLIVAKQASNSIDLSEQQLVSCSKLNNGCNGGMMDRAFSYVINNGLTTEADYPYTATQTACKKATQDLSHIKSFVDVAQGCVSDLKIAVALQPVAIAVDATNWSQYTNGVFSNCGTQLNHGVLLVGFQNNAWLVKNSWGTSWGQNGYIQLAAGNTCGLANVASYPTA